MFSNHHYIPMGYRVYMLIAGAVGVLTALLATVRILLPTVGILAQFSQVSLLMRTILLIKILSPLLSFCLAGGWTWVLLVTGEQLIARWKNRGVSRQQKDLMAQVQQPHYHLATSVTPPISTMEGPIHRINERKRPIAAPPLFQLDPTNPKQRAHLPVTPFLATHPAWIAYLNPEGDESHKQQGKVTNGEASELITQTLQTISIPEADDTSQEEQEEPEKANPSRTILGSIFLRPSDEPTKTIPPVTLTLLKQMQAWVRADDGTTVEVSLRRGERGIRLFQLAYIAWQQGKPVDRDKMLTHVLSRGKRRDMTVGQLGETFDAAKRYLREDLNNAINELEKNGHHVTEKVDFFDKEPGFYWLHPSCRVIDLEKIEEHYSTIQIARKEGLLDEKIDGSIPERVVEACQKLVDAYPGDFLQSLIEKFPEECGAWVKQPVTFYRDRYLEALLIMAKYESALGKKMHGEDSTFGQQEEQRRHQTRAAQLFYDYAMYSINTPWDKKLTFAYKTSKDGERVIRSARAIRRCVVELGKIGNPDTIDQVYLTFKERMSILSEGTWKPDKDTEYDVTEAKKTTSAYRFSFQLPNQQDGHKNSH